MSVANNLKRLQGRIARACERSRRSPRDVTLVAVTKTVEPSLIQEAFDAGLRHFGENRVQEAEDKIPMLADMRAQTTWHMVGRLQTNKVSRTVRLFDTVDSVDSVALAEALSRAARHPLPVMLEVNVAGEASKGGMKPGDVPAALEAIGRLPNVAVKGLMTIAPAVSDAEEVRPVFRQLRQLRDALGLEHLSMGMTDDFEVAIEEGATVIRIGRAIFGERV